MELTGTIERVEQQDTNFGPKVSLIIGGRKYSTFINDRTPPELESAMKNVKAGDTVKVAYVDNPAKNNPSIVYHNIQSVEMVTGGEPYSSPRPSPQSHTRSDAVVIQGQDDDKKAEYRRMNATNTASAVIVACINAKIFKPDNVLAAINVMVSYAPIIEEYLKTGNPIQFDEEIEEEELPIKFSDTQPPVNPNDAF